MIRFLQYKSLQFSAAFITGIIASTDSAHASGNNFSSIAENITTSISQIPGLITGVSYMLGILFGVLGILKIKDHVEQPTQTQLKDGAIRLAAGGGLFSLPIVFEAMQQTVGDGSTVSAAQLNAVEFNVN